MFTNILAATDTITNTDAPVLTAMDLAGQYQARLTVLHVLEPASTTGRQQVKHYRTGNTMLAGRGYIEEVRQEIQRSYQPIPENSGEPRFIIRTGYPGEEILNTARKMDADLILLGAHSGQAEKKGGPRSSKRIGSTVEAVVSRENCPVMIVGRMIPKEKLEFKKIVVGIDFSISCECALCFSVKLSQNFNSTLYPFFMIPMIPYPKYTGSNYRADMKILRQKLEGFCDIYLDGTEHEYHIWGGTLPHREVLKCARKTDADLIILGSHTKMDTGKWYGKSVVEQVSIDASCPVMVLNDPKALKKWDIIRLSDAQGSCNPDRYIHLFHENSRDRACSSQ